MEELGQNERSQESLNTLFTLSLEQLKICMEGGLDLNHLYLLEAFDEGTDLSIHFNSPKLEGWKQTLIRKGYIDEKGIVQLKGKGILDAVRKNVSINSKPAKNISNEETDFDVWWKTYPGTDTFVIGEKTFRGTRTFRVEKETCRKLFERVLNTGKFTAKELIDAIKLDVENRKHESVKSGENKLKYLQNSATYLRQYSFEPYVELVRKGIKPVETTTIKRGGVSI